MKRIWRVAISVAVVCAALAAMALGASAAKPHGKATKRAKPSAGQLDPSFGTGGKTLVAVPPLPETGPQPGVEMATAPSGKSYVLDGSLLLAFSANGKPDRGFGQNGQVTVAAATGQTTNVADLTVDASGRILVTGSFEPTPGAIDKQVPAGEMEFSKPPISQAFVVRYLPSGERDGTFGTGGEIDVTLEMPGPTATEPGPRLHFEKPTVFASRISVVEGEMPVIGGHYQYSSLICWFPTVPAYAFSARLETGEPGARTLPTSAYTNLPSTDVTALTPTPNGGLAALVTDGVGCPLLGTPALTTTSLLNPDGTVGAMDPARPVLPRLQSTLAVDPSGRLLILESQEYLGEGGPWKLIRLLPNGDYDTGFGENGGMPLVGFDEEGVHSVNVDSRGRALVGGGDKRLRIVRVGTKAKIDHTFGNHGWAEAGFGKGTKTELEATTIDAKGRIIAVGRVKDESLPTGEGIGIVRFLPGG